MSISLREVRIQYFKSSGPGGQHKNKRFSAVRAIHVPTGLTAVASEERSQFQNKTIAIERLAEKLARLKKKKKKRIPVAMPNALKEKVLELKKRRSEKKRQRQRVNEDEW